MSPSDLADGRTNLASVAKGRGEILDLASVLILDLALGFGFGFGFDVLEGGLEGG